jgi:hypothetical protein
MSKLPWFVINKLLKNASVFLDALKNTNCIKLCLFFQKSRLWQRRTEEIKFGAVSWPMAPSKGALSVRQYHKTDESKILPTKRLGIASYDVNHT